MRKPRKCNHCSEVGGEPMKREEKKKLKAKEIQEKHLEETIKKSIPVEETEFLVQPLAWTMLKGDISKTQYVLMENLMEAFQTKFKAQIAANKKKQSQQPTLFGDDGQMPSVKIYFKELGVRADSYDELHKAAIALGKQIVEVEGRNEEGDKVISYMPLFSKISVPKKELEIINRKEGAKKTPYATSERRRGYVEIKINSEIGAEYLEMKGMHTKFLKNVAKKCSCDYSPRMYLYTATWRDLGGKWEFDFIVFRRLLGLRQIKLIETEKEPVYEEVDVKYENFSDVKRHILDKTMKELKELADADELDCYFSYEVVMPKGKTRGWPEKLLFYAHKSKLGERISAYNSSVQMNMKLEQLMIKELGMSKQSATSLTARLNEEIRVKFSNKLMELINFITNPENKIKDKGGYAFVALSNFLDEHATSATEIILEKNPTPDNNQAGGNVQQEAEDLGNVGENSGNEQSVGNYSAEALPAWWKVLDFIRGRMTKELFDIHILPLYPYSFENNVLTIAAPNEYIYKEVQTKYAARLLEIIREHFGASTEVKYVMENRRTDELVKMYEEHCTKK